MTILLGYGRNRRIEIGVVTLLGRTITGSVILNNGNGTTISVSGPLADKLAAILAESPEAEPEELRIPRGAEFAMLAAEQRRKDMNP
jgi:hypothetical protein